MEFLGRVELLLMPPPPVTLLLVVMLLFGTDEEHEGIRDDKPVTLGWENTELFEDVLETEELDCWLLLCDA